MNYSWKEFKGDLGITILMFSCCVLLVPMLVCWSIYKKPVKNI
jgi:hypothetical protein